MKTVFQLIALEPPGLLIGGFAMQRYGLTRQTFDVDIMIAHSQAPALAVSLEEAGYKVTAETDSFIQYRSDNLYLMDIDVLLVDEDTLEKMLAESSTVDVDDVTLCVPCLAHLVALKLHAVANNAERTAKDLADISELLRMNPGSISQDELDEIFNKYGTPEAVKILKALL